MSWLYRHDVWMRILSGARFMDLATRIRHARVAKSLTQRQLSEATGLTQQSISHFERGEARPSIDSLLRIARALGIQPGELLNSESLAA
jgi:transcriptional regulator with XRE-family HTH domain